MIRHAYKCKFCGKPGFVDADEAGLKVITWEKWQNNIACNRCGAFKERIRSLETSVLKICRSIQLLRVNSKLNEAQQKAEAALRNNIVELTRRMALVTCEHYRVAYTWDGEFPAVIFDKPEGALKVMRFYVGGMAKLAANVPVDML